MEKTSTITTYQREWNLILLEISNECDFCIRRIHYAVSAYHYIHKYQTPHQTRVLKTLAGLPPAIEFFGISFVTTLPAAITEPESIFTPGQITQFAPIHTSSAIQTFLWSSPDIGNGSPTGGIE
tara:strand:+ start:404 stop:775 length:372 start_codon:yes stop_codon:yes gene_type:complete